MTNSNLMVCNTAKGVKCRHDDDDDDDNDDSKPAVRTEGRMETRCFSVDSVKDDSRKIGSQ
jgi:hypothetical protein